MNKTEFNNLLAFLILMQNDKGLITKSPAYIMQKFQHYVDSPLDETPWGLDHKNQSLLTHYRKMWKGACILLVDKDNSDG